MHGHTHTFTHTVSTHTCTHTHTFTHMHTCVHSHTWIHIYTFTHALTLTHIQADPNIRKKQLTTAYPSCTRGTAKINRHASYGSGSGYLRCDWLWWKRAPCQRDGATACHAAPKSCQRTHALPQPQMHTYLRTLIITNIKCVFASSTKTKT